MRRTAAVVLVPFVTGCVLSVAHLPARSSDLQYSEVTEPDGWSRKIAEWQRRELGSREGRPEATGESAPSAAPEANDPRGTLSEEYLEFVELLRTQPNSDAEGQREVARRIVDWVQSQSLTRYRSDHGEDHWPSFAEVLSVGVDDCDGLELVVFRLLGELGFAEDEFYRSVLYRPDDGLYHMVTLWLEDPLDPWILDPTGAVSPKLASFSSASAAGWVPVRLFSERRELAAQSSRTPRL